MRQLAAALAMSADLTRRHASADWRNEEEWRALHRRPDALPDPVDPVRPRRRLSLSRFVIRRRRPQAKGV